MMDLIETFLIDSSRDAILLSSAAILFWALIKVARNSSTASGRAGIKKSGFHQEATMQTTDKNR